MDADELAEIVQSVLDKCDPDAQPEEFERLLREALPDVEITISREDAVN